MDIYLFCNANYGAPFIRSLCSLSLDGTKLNRTIVISSHTPLSLPRQLSRKLKLLWAIRRIRTGCRILVAHDINSDKFIQGIPDGAIGVVGGFNQIFSAKTITRFQSLVNLHPSILPMYRGAIPSYWCIHNGETKTGFTLHKIVKRIDAGEVLYQEYTNIQDTDTEELLDERIATQAAPVLERYIRSLATGESFPCQVLKPLYRTPVNYVPARRA